MAVPSKQLERTRGRILAESERLRVASRVQLIGGAENWGRRIRGKVVLALTDQRLLLVNQSVRVSNARVLSEWPAADVRISVTRRKLGASLIHVVIGDGRDLSFEWVDGHRAHDWANYLFRC